MNLFVTILERINTHRNIATEFSIFAFRRLNQVEPEIRIIRNKKPKKNTMHDYYLWDGGHVESTSRVKSLKGYITFVTRKIRPSIHALLSKKK